MSNELKLFVFPEYRPDYAEGLAFAIAGSVDEAQRMIDDEYISWQDEKVVVHKLDEPVAYSVSGSC